MSRKQILTFVLILTVFIVSYLLLNRISLTAGHAKDPREISVICRGQDTESWTTIKLGIDQAANDFNADVSFITLSSDNNVSEQISLLNREVDNGTDAVVIAPVDSPRLKAAMETAAKKIPVVALQSTIPDMAGLRTVSCNYTLMGQKLAREVASQNRVGRKVVVFQNNMDCSNVADSFRGAENALKGFGFSVSACGIPDDSGDAYRAAMEEIEKTPDGIFVALDGNTLEAVSNANKDLSKTRKTGASIYGVGRTNAVASLLEEKNIDAIGVENEYSMGYLCIKTAVDSISHKSDGNTDVNFVIVNSTNMYQPENERILFPFVR